MNMQIIQTTVRSREMMTDRQPEKESSGDFLSILKEQSRNQKESAVEKTEKPARKTEKNKPASDQREAEAMSGQAGLENSEDVKTDTNEKPAEEKQQVSAVEEDQLCSDQAETANIAVFEDIFGGNVNGGYGQTAPAGGTESTPIDDKSGKQTAAVNDVNNVNTAQDLNGQMADLAAASMNGGDDRLSSMPAENRAKQTNEGIGSAKESNISKDQPMLMKAAGMDSENEKSGSENMENGSQTLNQDGKELTKWFSLDHGGRGERIRESGESVVQQGENSLEELQKKAEQQSILPFERMVGAKLSGGATTPVMNSKGVTDATPLPEQLRTGIEEGLAKQMNQFTIRLKPEGLGEILVHMTSTGGKVALSIGVSNMDTQKLLSSEMMHLKETLEPLHAEVQEIYHNSQGGMEMMNYEQGFFRNQQENASGNVHKRFAGNSEEEEDEAVINMPEAAGLYAGAGILSAYI